MELSVEALRPELAFLISLVVTGLQCKKLRDVNVPPKLLHNPTSVLPSGGAIKCAHPLPPGHRGKELTFNECLLSAKHFIGSRCSIFTSSKEDISKSFMPKRTLWSKEDSPSCAFK